MSEVQKAFNEFAELTHGDLLRSDIDSWVLSNEAAAKVLGITEEELTAGKYHDALETIRGRLTIDPNSPLLNREDWITECEKAVCALDGQALEKIRERKKVGIVMDDNAGPMGMGFSKLDGLIQGGMPRGDVVIIGAGGGRATRMLDPLELMYPHVIEPLKIRDIKAQPWGDRQVNTENVSNPMLKLLARGGPELRQKERTEDQQG